MFTLPSTLEMLPELLISPILAFVAALIDALRYP